MTKEKFWERIQANVKVDQSEVLRPWDAAELKAMRKSSEFDAKRMGWRFQGFTCDSCLARERCAYVYDLYNTDGDCLADK